MTGDSLAVAGVSDAGQPSNHPTAYINDLSGGEIRVIKCARYINNVDIIILFSAESTLRAHAVSEPSRGGFWKRREGDRTRVACCVLSA